MLRRVDLEDAMAPLAGKRVAVVGNSAEILKGGHGAAIDTHDVVIRMNRGMPGYNGAPEKAIGKKITVLGCGVVSPFQEVFRRAIPEYLWWFKLTPAGAAHLKEVDAYMPLDGLPLFMWPQGLEDLLTKKIGAAPSSGIRIIHLLLNWADVKSVTLFGFTFWGAAGEGSTVNWHSGWKASVAHDPGKEYAYFGTLGFTRAPGTGVWFRDG